MVPSCQKYKNFSPIFHHITQTLWPILRCIVKEQKYWLKCRATIIKWRSHWPWSTWKSPIPLAFHQSSQLPATTCRHSDDKVAAVIFSCAWLFPSISLCPLFPPRGSPVSSSPPPADLWCTAWHPLISPWKTHPSAKTATYPTELLASNTLWMGTLTNV